MSEWISHLVLSSASSSAALALKIETRLLVIVVVVRNSLFVVATHCHRQRLKTMTRNMCVCTYLPYIIFRERIYPLVIATLRSGKARALMIFFFLEAAARSGSQKKKTFAMCLCLILGRLIHKCSNSNGEPLSLSSFTLSLSGLSNLWTQLTAIAIIIIIWTRGIRNSLKKKK